MKNKKLIMSLIIGGIIVVLIIGIAITGAFIILFKSPTASNTTNSLSLNESTIDPNTLGINSNSKIFKDGTYSADGPYFAPGGLESINVSVTVSKGVVSSVNITGSSSDRRSNQYIETIKQIIANLIVGKPLDQAYPDAKLTGASLTAQGFNTALDNIIKQASK